MTHQERNEQITILLKECTHLLNTKGIDYAGEKEANNNFITNGQRLNLDPKVILLVYLMKHIDKIVNTITANPEKPLPKGESIRESIIDSINYLSILSTL
jgi:hypothetical protein